MSTERTLAVPIQRGTVKSLKIIEVVITYQTDDGQVIGTNIDAETLTTAMQKRLVDTCEAHLKIHMGGDDEEE